MLVYPSFCYLQNHKTGCTFVETCLRKFCVQPLLGYKKHAALAGPPGKFCFTNVRDPLELYRSLYAYGLEGQGTVFLRFNRFGHGDLYKQEPEGFANWLGFVLNARHAPLLSDYYVESVAELVGFMSWRFLRLACPGFEKAAPNLKNMDELIRFVKQNYVLNAVLRQENLREDLRYLVQGQLRPYFTDHVGLSAWLDDTPAINASRINVSDAGLSEDLIERLQLKERFLYQNFYSNQSGDRLSGMKLPSIHLPKLKALKALPGYAYGLQTACLLVRLELVPSPIYPWLSTVNQALAEAVHNHARGASMPASSLSPPSDDSLECLLFWLDIFYRLAEVPVFESPRIQVRKAAEALLAIPSPVGAQRPMGNLMTWLIELFDRSTRQEALTAQLEKMPEMLASLKATSPRSSNVPLFLRAAHELQIPAETIVGQTVQFGQGVLARWLDSTFTDVTPQIAASLSRNKMHAASVMRQAGVPVPAHALAKNEEEAVQIAESLGYPVVVKPADRDGGSGGAAGLVDAAEVREAFAAARRKSSMILVERHVPGRDYRLAVMNGKVFQAVERVPGGVTGNGVDSIIALVDTLNADPRRGVGHHAALKKLVLDEEALALLDQAELTVESIPEAGRFVRLRRRANITAGGIPVAVFPQVHPDNLKLAVRAAAALRLDIAGVDLISPDITRSWKETGAAVCEINGQPQLGVVTNEHVYAEVLSSLIEGEGRIPMVLVLGASETGSVAADIAGHWRRAGLEAAWADWSGVWIGGERIVDGPVPLHAAGRMILRDRTVEMAVLSVEDAGVLQTGLPCDRYDLLIIAQPRLRFTRRIDRSKQDRILREILAMILPACRKAIYCLDEAGVRLGGLAQFSPLPWPDTPIALETLFERINAHFSGGNILLPEKEVQ